MIRIVSDSCGFFGHSVLAREVSRHSLWACGPQVAQSRIERQRAAEVAFAAIVRPRDLPEADVFAD